jgi:N-acetylneuraminate lyase
MLGGLAMGADGGIGSAYNFMAEKFIKLLSLFNENKMAEAQMLQKEINEIIAALCEVGVMQGEKAILCAMGLDFGKMRAPFGEIPEEKENTLLEKVMPLLA